MTGSQLADAMQGRRAGLVTRVVADLVDLGILWLLGLLMLLSVGVGRYLLRGAPFALPAPAWWLSTTVGALLATAYLGSCWAATGRTPGKQLAGLRLISTSGEPLSAAASLLRATLCVVFPLGLLWILVSRRNGSAQDLLVSSAVVYDWSHRATRTRRP
jgi:uncharacterized RDD family membrane protein YckC